MSNLKIKTMTKLQFFRGYPILFLTILVCLFVRCNIDEGLNLVDEEELIKHGIKGEIVFNGTWQENIAEARLVAATSLEIEGEDLTESFIFSDPIQVGVDRVNYELSLNPAEYGIVAVILREKETSWDISNILAVYQPLSPCSILPDFDNPIKIETETSIVDSVNLFVDLSKGAITGNVDFIGEWPADISIAAILAFEAPFSLIPCGLSILPVGVETADYKVLIPENTYSIAVVAGQGLSLSEITFIGAYFEPGTTNPGAVEVGKNEVIQDINLTADLNLLSN